MRLFMVMFGLLLGVEIVSMRAIDRVVENSWKTKAGDDFQFAQIWGQAKYVKFQLKNDGEAVICLSTSMTCDEPSRSLMVTLGCNGNKMLEVTTRTVSKFFNYDDLLNASEFVNFTMFWDEGLISIWKDTDKPRTRTDKNKAICTLRDENSIDVKYFGFSTKSSPGNWIIAAPTEPCENEIAVCSSRRFEELYTMANEDYIFLLINGKEGKLRFEVKAAHDAGFVLSTLRSAGYLHRQIEGALGIKNNMRSILLFSSVRRREVDTHNVLKEHDYVGFWLFWTQGYVSLWVDGQEEAVATKMISEGFEEIRYLGIQTKENNGYWKISFCETDSSLETTTEDNTVAMTEPTAPLSPPSTNDDKSYYETNCLMDGGCPNGFHCTHFSSVCDETNYCVSRWKPFCSCEPEAYNCDVMNCILNSERCNGRRDCSNGVDENECVCTTDQLKCGDLGCILKSQGCDGLQNCEFGEDEEDCVSCNGGAFKCSNVSKCIRDDLRCDGNDDCGDGSDEVRCETCNSGTFKCGNYKCISKDLNCDGNDDCGDGSDEVLGCFKCNNSNTSKMDSKCDGTDDCGDGSDEAGCVVCNGSFKCRSAKCVKDDWVCNGADDCGDGSDEDKCNGIIWASEV